MIFKRRQTEQRQKRAAEPVFAALECHSESLVPRVVREPMPRLRARGKEGCMRAQAAQKQYKIEVMLRKYTTSPRKIHPTPKMCTKTAPSHTKTSVCVRLGVGRVLKGGTVYCLVSPSTAQPVSLQTKLLARERQQPLFPGPLEFQRSERGQQSGGYRAQAGILG